MCVPPYNVVGASSADPSQTLDGPTRVPKITQDLAVSSDSTGLQASDLGEKAVIARHNIISLNAYNKQNLLAHWY